MCAVKVKMMCGSCCSNRLMRHGLGCTGEGVCSRPPPQTQTHSMAPHVILHALFPVCMPLSFCLGMPAPVSCCNSCPTHTHTHTHTHTSCNHSAPRLLHHVGYRVYVAVCID
jgi:hypothetical protein